jgi:hypothetical protein
MIAAIHNVMIRKTQLKNIIDALSERNASKVQFDLAYIPKEDGGFWGTDPTQHYVIKVTGVSNADSKSVTFDAGVYFLKVHETDHMFPDKNDRNLQKIIGIYDDKCAILQEEVRAQIGIPCEVHTPTYTTPTLADTLAKLS